MSPGFAWIEFGSNWLTTFPTVTVWIVISPSVTTDGEADVVGVAEVDCAPAVTIHEQPATHVASAKRVSLIALSVTRLRV